MGVYLLCTKFQDYATAMKELATTHWTDETTDKGKGTQCRNKWIRFQCYEYFFNDGMTKFHKRENDIRKKMTDAEIDVDSAEPFSMISVGDNDRAAEDKLRIKVLDVGSCYNPLGGEEMFDVTAVDISPSVEEVLQCDFLNTRLGRETVLSEDGRAVEQLAEESFDAVVFSLLLEYFPCPEQRYSCCQRAYKLLKPGGILLVITPDSNHVGANAKVMKSWRLVLSKLGFMRIVYEKSRHLHCLGFRKCVDKRVAARWAELQNVSESDTLLIAKNKIYIPQDFQNAAASEKPCERVVYEAEELVSDFGELPCADCTSE